MVVVGSAVLPLPIRDALGVVLLDKTMRDEEEEFDMAHGAGAHRRLQYFLFE